MYCLFPTACFWVKASIDKWLKFYSRRGNSTTKINHKVACTSSICLASSSHSVWFEPPQHTNTHTHTVHYKSHEIPIWYCKSHVLCLNVHWDRRFVWNHYHHSTKLYREKITRLLPLALLLVLHTHNNTDGNKLVIFSGIALYYGDTCITVFSNYL